MQTLKKNNITLRPRQEQLIENTLAVLEKKNNALCVAPTGFGKSICIGALLHQMLESGRVKKALVIQHRDELTSQNKAKFETMTGYEVGVVDGKTKDWKPITFGMIQTIQRRLKDLPHFELLVIDEAHHARAKGYIDTITALRKHDPKLKIVGFTATPNRGDKKGLGKIFKTVADQVMLKELIDEKLLAYPKTYIKDLTNGELEKVGMIGGDYDMEAVDALMNTMPINEQVFDIWQDMAQDRKTVIFCATVKHAYSILHLFQGRGIRACIIHGDLKNDVRVKTLSDYANGFYQVIVNVMVLTEGWDDPATSCVVLLRPSSHKGLYIQMVGRGLRQCEGKEDCLILDFGGSSKKHGTLEQEIQLKDKPPANGEAPYKICPECEAEIPTKCKVCPLCNAVQPEKEPEEPREIKGMKEFDIMPQKKERSEIIKEFFNTVHGTDTRTFVTMGNLYESFHQEWVTFKDGNAIVRVCTAINQVTEERLLFAITETKERCRVFVGQTIDGKFAINPQGEALAIRDAVYGLRRSLRQYITNDNLLSSLKGRPWHKKPPTDKQINALRKFNIAPEGLNAYQATCILSYYFSVKSIMNK
ncbi:type I site specific restriction modification protein [Caudoviricetes sp.]|nr:type I site specific restriction modification protein [Caudoviricetes sp.]